MDDSQELYIRSRTMDAIPSERLRWVWQGRAAEGMITDLVGDPGLGKSTVLMDMVARVTSGRRMPDDETVRPPADAVILAGEDDPNQTIRPRLDNAGADVSRVIYIDVASGETGASFPLSFPKHLDMLDMMLESRDVRLLIMDPLDMFLGESVDTNNSSSVRVVLSKLKAIAEKHRMAVIMARHRVKSRDTDPLRTGQGSMGILGAARFGFLVGRDPTDEERERVVVAPTKTNASSPASAITYRVESVLGSDAGRIKWLGFSPIETSELIAMQRSVAEMNRVNDAREWLRDVLRGGEQPVKEVHNKGSREDGFDVSEIKEAVDLEGVRRKKGSMDGATFGGQDKGWYYYYPGTDRGGTPPDEDGHTETDIDPDEYNPGRTAPVGYDTYDFDID